MLGLSLATCSGCIGKDRDRAQVMLVLEPLSFDEQGELPWPGVGGRGNRPEDAGHERCRCFKTFLRRTPAGKHHRHAALLHRLEDIEQGQVGGKG